MTTELVIGSGTLQIKIVQGVEPDGTATYTVYLIGQVEVGHEFIEIASGETYSSLAKALDAVQKLSLG
jgi:hypothetical protein